MSQSQSTQRRHGDAVGVDSDSTGAYREEGFESVLCASVGLSECASVIGNTSLKKQTKCQLSNRRRYI